MLKYLERGGISLGKTIQALAISGYLKHNKVEGINDIKRCLIICPATLKAQWGQEIEKFTNESYMIIDGGKGAKAQQKRVQQYTEVREKNIFYTIVNYELLIQKERLGKETVGRGKNKKNKIIKGDFIDLNQILENEYDMIVIDEAQRMRNLATQACQAIYQIQHPQVRLLMTGTPIEKDLQHIFPLLDYICPKILSDDTLPLEERYRTFKDKFLVIGLNSYKLSKFGIEEEEIKGVRNANHLKRLIAPYTLRRKTEEVSDELPSSSEHMYIAEWDKHQQELYKAIQEELNACTEKLGKEKDEEKIEQVENTTKAYLMYLLATCNTPQLLFMSESPIAKQILKKVTVMKNALEKKDAIEKNKKLTPANKEKELKELYKKEFFTPPKLKRLLEIIEEVVIENEHKIVIFTKYETMTRIMKEKIENLLAKTNHKIVMYTGKVDKTCKWKAQLQKEGKESKNLACNQCPLASTCNSRTKSQWHFQNNPNTKVIICTDAANYGVKVSPPTLQNVGKKDGQLRETLAYLHVG